MIRRRELLALALLIGATACGQAPQPAAPVAAPTSAKAPAASTAKYAAKVPASIWTPDSDDKSCNPGDFERVD